ncbi:hypothetical protein NECAME_12412 [Necator americanus]|uniref:Uncharacterized protein n=1 Tax=Necator americanus TaxID=51031 RepID=W2T2H4_NECAM|nr:hypothetical protein NECAME_12412 [Necator americanus]ETN75426.1 hypothetical protein NECAME_12412 [Necator americanus]
MEKIFSWSSCSGWLCLACPVQDAVQINFFTHKNRNRCIRHSRLLFEGSRSENVVVQRKSDVSTIAWHPTEVIVCVAWSDGLLNILSPESSEYAATENVGSKVLFLSWSADGKSLCAAKETAAHSKNWQLETSSAIFSFVVGCEGGALHLIEQSGSGLKLHQLDYRIEFVAHFHQKGLLIALASDMMLYHFNISPETTANEKLRVKLNGKAGSTVVVLREKLLLICHQERDLRVWDLESDENGTISLQSAKGFDGDDVILCMDYSKQKGMISAGTMKGKVANWKYRAGESTVENSWRLQNGNQVGEKITSIEWCSTHSALAVNAGNELTILQEGNNITCLRNKVLSVKTRRKLCALTVLQIAAIQSGPSSFTLINVFSSVSQELKLTFEVVGINVQEKQLVVWSLDTVATFDVQSSLATIQSSIFSCSAQDILIHQHTLYCIERDKINVRTLQVGRNTTGFGVINESL